MKNIKFIIAGLVAAALSLTTVSGAQAYPPGIKPKIIITGGVVVNNKPAVVRIGTKAGAHLTVTINGDVVAEEDATSSSFVVPVSWKKAGKYTIQVDDGDATQTTTLWVPKVVTPRKGKIAKAGTVSFKFIEPGTMVSVKVNNKVALKAIKIGKNGTFTFKLVKKYLKKGKNTFVIYIGKTKITSQFMGS